MFPPMYPHNPDQRSKEEGGAPAGLWTEPADPTVRSTFAMSGCQWLTILNAHTAPITIDLIKTHGLLGCLQFALWNPTVALIWRGGIGCRLTEGHK